jgi:GntR family transcriptional regulator, phosphonate transport system regulatory protein
MNNHTPGLAVRPHTKLEPAEGPRWERIAQLLREDIVAGHRPAGSRLPNESQLAAQFGVHRHTLRQAMQRLATEGFVHVRQGAGTFVRELVLDYALQRRTRLSENLASNGERGQRELLAHGHAEAGEWGSLLGVPRRAPVAWLDLKTVVRGRPLGLTHAVYPLPRLAGMAEAFARSRSVTAALQSLGVPDYLRQRSQITARRATVAEADALARPASEPVIVVSFVNVDRAGLPIEAGQTVFAADAVQLVIEHAE